MAKEAAGRVRRRERKNITSGVVHVNSTFNNTMITIADAQGNVIAWASSGHVVSRARYTPRPALGTCADTVITSDATKKAIAEAGRPLP